MKLNKLLQLHIYIQQRAMATKGERQGGREGGRKREMYYRKGWRDRQRERERERLKLIYIRTFQFTSINSSSSTGAWTQNRTFNQVFNY